MKKIVVFIILILNNTIFSQEKIKAVDSPTNISTKTAYFYKNSWIPFSGNLQFELKYKNHNYLAKIKMVNGFPVKSELLLPETNKLKYIVTLKNINGFDTNIIDSLDIKPFFNEQDEFTDTLALRKLEVTNYYHRIKKTTIPLNGFVIQNKRKIYYEKGMIVSIELFFDTDCKKIKSRYAIFHTDIGNIEISEAKFLTYEGAFTEYDEQGKVVYSGTNHFEKKPNVLKL